MKTYYLGAFPPGYGGVTRKNENLYIALSQKTEISRVDFNAIKRKRFKELFRLIAALCDRRARYVIGVSGKKTRRLFTALLYYWNRKAMGRSAIMIMGGTFGEDMVAQPRYRRWASGYGCIYVETQGMLRRLREAGLENGAIYPNGRFCPKTDFSPENTDGRLKCLFFSQVSREKGVDILLEAAKICPDVDFSVYGKVVENFREEFRGLESSLPNVTYEGLCKLQGDELYELLHRYDVMLFPTKWDIEGVPGTLVEAKIAGIPSIVSDKSFNRELVEDGEAGLVLKENTPQALADAIGKLDADRTLLYKLKQGSFASAREYYIENYTDDILAQLGGDL